jgi:hypothetical protein
VGLTILSCEKKIVEKPPRNSAGFCGGGQGLSWAVEPRKEEEFLYAFLSFPIDVKCPANFNYPDLIILRLY